MVENVAGSIQVLRRKIEAARNGRRAEITRIRVIHQIKRSNCLNLH